MSKGWKKPSLDKRRAYIQALRGRRRPLTATELGQMLDVDPSTALQMLYALERDEVVARAPGGGKNIVWRLTGKSLPAALSPSGPVYTPSFFDARALCEALGMVPRGVIMNARAIMLGERRP